MGKNIIIVEDDPFSHQYYNYVFSKAGYCPFIIENGDLIIDKLTIDEVSLIILDINLKNTFLNGNKIDGIDFAKFLKSHKLFKNIPILLVTASSDFSKNYFISEGIAEDFILKPITDYKTLLKKVNQLVN